jgi:hypothetical protein
VRGVTHHLARWISGAYLKQSSKTQARNTVQPDMASAGTPQRWVTPRKKFRLAAHRLGD